MPSSLLSQRLQPFAQRNIITSHCVYTLPYRDYRPIYGTIPESIRIPSILAETLSAERFARCFNVSYRVPITLSYQSPYVAYTCNTVYPIVKLFFSPLIEGTCQNNGIPTLHKRMYTNGLTRIYRVLFSLILLCPFGISIPSEAKVISYNRCIRCYDYNRLYTL